MAKTPDDPNGTYTRRQALAVGAAAAAAAQIVVPGLGLLAPDAAQAHEGREPLGGQPPTGATPSVSDFAYQVAYQRAFEAALWAMPALAIHAFRRSAFSQLGMKDNDIIACSTPATPKIEALTANSTTPYIAAYTDLRKGPVVLELPVAGADGSLYGQVVDAWQLTIADVGPSGIDAGKGGKILFTPPGYLGEIPADHLHVSSPSFRVAFAFRSIPAPGKTAEDAYHYSKRLRMYYLSEASDPPPQTFVDPMEPRYERYSTLPLYDERLFDDLYEIVSVEPVQDQDKVMMGMLSSLGIQQSQPFAPSEPARRAMRQAAIDVWFYLQGLLDELPDSLLYWPDRHYTSILQTDANRTFSFVYDDRIDVTTRALQYFWCTYVPKSLSDTPATQYMMAVADSDGQPLQAGRLYKLEVPADMPVKQFWALTIYDRATFAFIYSESNRTTLSSFDVPDLTTNADGSVTIYVGPVAPEGLEANWIPTSGKRPLPAVRFYGPTEAFNTKTFKMPDFELVG
jgi:hypothetical protein